MNSTDICKMALAEIGTRSTISSLTDGSTEALYCNMYYASVRDQALAAARWQFARHIDTMTLWKALPGTPENTTPVTMSGWQRTYPPPPWLYSYELPADFLYPWSIIAQPNNPTLTPPIFSTVGLNLSYPQSLKATFDLSTDAYDQAGALQSPQRYVINTNQQTPLIEYTYRCIDENLFTPLFIMIIVKAMAGYLAAALTSDKQLANMRMTEANNAIVTARASDGNAGITIFDHVPDWLTIRGVVGGTIGLDSYNPYGPLFIAM